MGQVPLRRRGARVTGQEREACDEPGLVASSVSRQMIAARALLDSGIYTVSEAAELVEAEPNETRIWIEGRKGVQDPVIDNDLGRIGNKTAVSFTNLMELRFISLFHNAGVRLSEIRAILAEARDQLSHPHPFATRTIFRTDGKKIVSQIAKKNGVTDIYDLKSRNYEMHEVVMASLIDDVVYDPQGEAISWKPRPRIAPNVILHPAHSFGQPILSKSLIPTFTIAKTYKVERNLAVVAEMFEIPKAQVREAISFDRNLRREA